MHNSIKIIKTLLYSYFALHVSGTLVPIIRSLLILHIQPSVTVCRWVGCIFQLWSVTTVAFVCLWVGIPSHKHTKASHYGYYPPASLYICSHCFSWSFQHPLFSLLLGDHDLEPLTVQMLTKMSLERVLLWHVLVLCCRSSICPSALQRWCHQ
jgi:hypothetical protein